MKLIVTLATLVLAGLATSGDDAVDATPPPNVDDDGLDLRIDIGRLGVINQHTEEIWLKMRADDSRHDADDPVQLDAALRMTVWQFNLLRENLCSDRFLVEKSCGPAYVPRWMFESRDVPPSRKELEARYAELEDRIVPFWDAACDRLKKVISENDSMEYCSVE
jgi:hypothetical protein